MLADRAFVMTSKENFPARTTSLHNTAFRHATTLGLGDTGPWGHWASDRLPMPFLFTRRPRRSIKKKTVNPRLSYKAET